MILTLIVLITIFTLSVNAQNEFKTKISAKSALSVLVRNDKIKSVKPQSDSIPSVVFVKSKTTTKQLAYYLNGKLANPSIIKTLAPNLIDSIQVERGEFDIKGELYNGKLYIKTKKDYRPKLVSLSDLKSKYIPDSKCPVIFMIEGDLIKGDYSKYVVDEKYILKIIVDYIDQEDSGLQVDIIRLLTKTDENIKQANEIRIQGMAEVGLN